MRHTWAVLTRGDVYCICLTLPEATATAARLRAVSYRASDVAIAPRPTIHPGWGLRWRGEGRR